MHTTRRITIALLGTALLCLAAYGAGNAMAAYQDGHSTSRTSNAEAERRDQEGPRTPRGTAKHADTGKNAEPNAPVPPVVDAEPVLEPGPRLLGPGDDDDQVKDLQARLKQVDWFSGDVTGYYGDVTTEAVQGFQAKREIPVTGEVDQRTLNLLHAMTTAPTQAELDNEPPVTSGNTPGSLDPRCRSGRVLCVDKSSQTLRWVVDGQVHQTVDVRFGAESTPTREGAFAVNAKDRDHVSTLYGSEMPFSMFFSGGQAVHYSSDFASDGYAGASHGCVNVRDYDAVAWLYDQVQIGDAVIVYWS